MPRRKQYQVAALEHGRTHSKFEVKLETNKPREAARAAARMARGDKHTKVITAKGAEAMTCTPITKIPTTRSGRRNTIITAECRPQYWFKQLIKGR